MVEQLRIDIEVNNTGIGVDKELYNVICEVIESFGHTILDDGSAPYTEDMTEQYNKLRGVK